RLPHLCVRRCIGFLDIGFSGAAFPPAYDPAHRHDQPPTLASFDPLQPRPRVLKLRMQRGVALPQPVGCVFLPRQLLLDLPDLTAERPDLSIEVVRFFTETGPE